ncbi:hypothetical protein NG798_24615 [Ancylothrix sp. C2]|uniref:hypothetical protein n=1 Tax=Ancylothrix sp. D3o TaxID=2953691 RepID=UPI0021BAAB5D|nr:hypothetical protein [Ancylothrix sp. D3o]MCT7952986.1 hypothetical protein [Ancylothrix sp. D3o]
MVHRPYSASIVFTGPSTSAGTSEFDWSLNIFKRRQIHRLLDIPHSWQVHWLFYIQQGPVRFNILGKLVMPMGL